MKQKIVTTQHHHSNSIRVTSQESIFYFMVKSSTSVCMLDNMEVNWQ